MWPVLSHPFVGVATFAFSGLIVAEGASTANTAAVLLGAAAAFISAASVAYGTWKRYHGKPEAPQITLTGEELADLLERRDRH